MDNLMAAEPIVYLDGKLVPATQAHISIYNMGVVLGATVTDMTRTFRKRPYRLEDHIRRFYESCKYAHLDPPISPNETAKITGELIAHNAALLPPEGELGVIHFITPGENQVYAGSAGKGQGMKPTYCIHSFPLPFFLFQKVISEGAHLVVPSTRHIPPQCVDPKIKNRSRLHWWLADYETHLVDPDAMTWLLDLDGNLTESGGANVLIVKDGTVLSPSPRNILLGISRKIVFELCAKLNIPTVERDLQLHDALIADEIFLTTTPYCMAPVTRVNGIPIGDGKTGKPIFERILSAWSAEVGVDIRGQLLNSPHA